MKGIIFRSVGFMRFQQPGEQITALFFGLLTTGLFLGDGKQGVIDVYGATVVLILWFLRMVYVPLPVSSPRANILRVWGVVFSVAVVSAVFSDSIGYSISWIVRLTSAYLLYLLFFDLARHRVVTKFISGLFILTVVATGVSLILWIFPGLDAWLPSMSLVGMQFGHNHLADLLVFVAPLVFLPSLFSSVRVYSMVGCAFIVSLLLTKARASWALVFIYVSAYVLLMSEGLRRAVLLFVLLSVLCAGLLYGKTITDARPASLVVRTQYWNQAVRSFAAHPLIGNGPGTFSLAAVHVQRFGESVSWFAHSQLLQILAETGLFGIAAFIWLWIVHARTWIVHAKKYAVTGEVGALIAGVILCFIYSMFDYVLDYFLIWLLFWSCVGLITGTIAPTQVAVRSGPPKAPLFVIGVFYVLWIIGNGFGFLGKKYDTAFYVAPFDVVLAHLYMTRPGHSITESGIRLVRMFHEGNPDALYQTALYRRRHGDDAGDAEMVRRAVYSNPQDMPLVREYLAVLSRQDPDAAGSNMVTLLTAALPDAFGERVRSLSVYGHQIGTAIRKLDGKQPVRLREQYVSVLYVIGLESIDDSPELTLLLWGLARDIHPDFAAIHIEISRLFKHVFGWPVSARDSLLYCMRFPSARGQCEAVLGMPLLPPGDYYDALN